MIVGIVGGGQLARMMALAGLPMGWSFIFLDPSSTACAAPLGEHLCAAYDDETALAYLAERADVVTYEFENVPPESIEALSRSGRVFPTAQALAISRDRLSEKTLMQRLAIPTAPFASADSMAALVDAVDQIGLPAVAKRRTMGYDGKGQAVLRSAEDLAPTWAALGGAPLLIEALVDFDREVSIIGVRSRNGETFFYPLAQNVHHGGILGISFSRAGDLFEATAQAYAQLLFDHLDYVGVLALELFQVGDTLLANEMAPRVHNSGHWTIEACSTSQFENHLRAIAGLALGSTDARGHAAMVNFIGALPDPAEVLSVPGAHLHIYGKEPRPGRKLGHATIVADDDRQLHAALEQMPLERRDAQVAGS